MRRAVAAEVARFKPRELCIMAWSGGVSSNMFDVIARSSRGPAQHAQSAPKRSYSPLTVGLCLCSWWLLVTVLVATVIRCYAKLVAAEVCSSSQDSRERPSSAFAGPLEHLAFATVSSLMPWRQRPYCR